MSVAEMEENMSIQGESAFTLLKKLEFTRTAGTQEEFRAVKMLEEEVQKAGVPFHMEAFEIDEALEPKAILKVMAPYEKEYVVTGYKCCASTPKEGITAELLYVENAMAVNLADAKGKIVLVNSKLKVPQYKRMMEAGVAGFITMGGSMLDEEHKTDLEVCKVRKNMAQYGIVPAAHIRIADAFELVSEKATTVNLWVENTNITLDSHNLIARIEGTTNPEEVIVFGGHYDSVPFSKGVYDNGAGSVILVELLKYFKANPPKRTLEFVWFGSEEIGLQGSWNYVKTHKEELEAQCRMMVNIDVAAPVLGFEHIAITGPAQLEHYTDYWTKIHGYAVMVMSGTYSSDSIPFADNGIPAINISRDGVVGGAFMHSRHDVIKYLSAESLSKTIELIQNYTEELINAVVFPVKKEIPEDIKGNIDKYMYRGKWANLD